MVLAAWVGLRLIRVCSLKASYSDPRALPQIENRFKSYFRQTILKAILGVSFFFLLASSAPLDIQNHSTFADQLKDASLIMGRLVGKINSLLTHKAHTYFYQKQALAILHRLTQDQSNSNITDEDQILESNPDLESAAWNNSHSCIYRYAVSISQRVSQKCPPCKLLPLSSPDHRFVRTEWFPRPQQKNFMWRSARVL